MWRSVEGRDIATVAREERDAHVVTPPMQMVGEIAERLRRIAEPVEEENSPLVSGTQVKWTCASGDLYDGGMMVSYYGSIYGSIYGPIYRRYYIL